MHVAWHINKYVLASIDVFMHVVTTNIPTITCTATMCGYTLCNYVMVELQTKYNYG